jgi:DNA replication protein DnaC
LNDRLRGHDETIGERLVRDQAALLQVPATPYEACEKKAARVNSLSLARYRGNDYSVPTAYGHREVLIRGYVHEVVISCAAEESARHPRSYEREDFVFNPLHYLALLERKIGALDQAAPLVGWELPKEFATLRRLLEARMGKPGQAGVRPGAALDGGVPSRRCTGRCQRSDRRQGDRLRRSQAPGPVPHRAPPAAAGPEDLSLPPAGHGNDHLALGLLEPAGRRSIVMSDTPQVLLAHHLKALRLPTFLREYDKLARQRAAEGVDHSRYLLRLAELEMIDRERRTVERRIKEAKFPAVKSLDSFDFTAIPSLNKTLVLELARSEYVARRENVIAVGDSGTGKTHVALGLGLAACQKGLAVGFTTAAALVHELHEARDEKRLLRLQHQLAGYKFLIVDELGYVPLSPTGAELLFEVFSQRYERGSIIVTSNLPFDEWTGVFASERLAGALLDRLTHHVHILEMNGDSFRLKHSKRHINDDPPPTEPG